MKLAIGTAQFGMPYGIANQSGQVCGRNAESILTLAITSGIDMIDTAISYGESEKTLGRIGVDGFSVITKLPVIPESVSDVESWIVDQTKGSMRRLGVDNVYGLLLHRPDQLAGPDGGTIARTLQVLKADGLVDKVGISIYSSGELEQALEMCDIDLVQSPFNLIDRSLFTSGWLQRLSESGVEIHARSVFLQGLLLMSRAEVPKKFEPWSKLWDDWHSWLSEQSVSATKASLNFVQGFSQFDRIVVGVDTVEQLQELVDSARTFQLQSAPDICCTDEMLIDPSNWSSL